MLSIIIPEAHLYDSKNNLFIDTPKTELELEHCLHSVYEWEKKWKKPFMDNNRKTLEETRDYIRCMALGKDIDPLALYGLTNENLRSIDAYIHDPMTATTFSNRSNRRAKKEIITAEIMYYWIVAFGIPFEVEYWHLNSLITLIKVCDVKNTPSKKMKKGDIYKQNAALNAARCQRLNTRG